MCESETFCIQRLRLVLALGLAWDLAQHEEFDPLLALVLGHEQLYAARYLFKSELNSMVVDKFNKGVRIPGGALSKRECEVLTATGVLVDITKRSQSGLFHGRK